jgi:hypothetical protein
MQPTCLQILLNAAAAILLFPVVLPGLQAPSHDFVIKKKAAANPYLPVWPRR